MLKYHSDAIFMLRNPPISGFKRLAALFPLSEPSESKHSSVIV